MRKTSLMFAGAELVCALLFAFLIFPVGHLYRVPTTYRALPWGLSAFYCVILLLVWLAAFRPWRHKRLKNLSVVIAGVFTFELFFYLLKQAIYWRDMADLQLSPVPGAAARYVLCLVVGTAAILLLALWGFFPRGAKKPEQA